MTQLAIIDLDGVVADATARFARADLAKEQWIMERQQGLPYAVDQATERAATDIYWRTVFNPENVSLDTLIDGAEEALYHLQEEAGYHVILLTSRPESMRQATIDWLEEHLDDLLPCELIMKPPAFQFTKTVVWKAGTIQQTLPIFYDADEVLVIDDEPANLGELMKYDTSHMRLCASLAEAITPAPEPDVNLDEHPF